MEIDYEKIKARANGVAASPALVLKYEIFYTEAGGKEKCENCANSILVKYPIYPREVMNCRIIGVNADANFIVGKNHHCMYHESKEKKYEDQRCGTDLYNSETSEWPQG